MEDMSILDSQITASSVQGGGALFFFARRARLNTVEVPLDDLGGSWSPAISDSRYPQWIHVHFDGTLKTVSGIITQGRDGTDEWVTEYSVLYGNDGVNWKYVKDGNNLDAVFIGNTDQSTQVEHVFASLIKSVDYIRIQPTQWNNYISMRFELLGCDVNEGPPFLRKPITVSPRRDWLGEFIVDLTFNIDDASCWTRLEIVFPRKVFELKVVGCDAKVKRNGKKTRAGKSLTVFTIQPDSPNNPRPDKDGNRSITLFGKTWKGVRGVAGRATGHVIYPNPDHLYS